MKIRSLAIVSLLVMLFSGVVSCGDYNSAAAILLDRIALGEGTSDAAAQQNSFASGYDVTYAYGKYNPKNSKPLTEMTIGEVKRLQQQMLANQAGKKLPSSAVGRYQLVSTTLAEQQKKLGLSDDTKFDATTQELFGLSLLEKRKYKEWTEGKISDYQFQKNLAEEWASVADPDTGKSYHGQGVGTTDAQIKEAMAQTESLLGIAVSGPSIGAPVSLILYIHDADANGPVIPGAQITGQDASGNSFEQTTDSSGYVTIIGDPGTWSFKASASGYVDNPWDQEITSTSRKDASLQKTSTQQESFAPTAQGSANSIVGEWILHSEISYSNSAAPTTTQIHHDTYKSDGTFIKSYNGEISTGKWIQTGNTIRLIYSNGMETEQTITGNTMNGFKTGISNGEGWTMRWTETRVGT